MRRFPRAGLSAVVAALVCSATLTALPQAGPAAAPRLRMNALDVAARLEAARQRLPYIPNQVVVKFKAGVARAGQQRALMAVRSRPSVDALRWMGQVAVLSDAAQSNPLILAEQLREQPEVEYAEPNYLYHPTAKPNDPGFTSHQWNFDAIDLPRAWDVNPGATSNVTIAIVDTGVTSATSAVVFRTWDGSGFVNAIVPFAVSPDISANRLVSPFDFAFFESTTVIDMVGHGTHVASTAGEDTNNDLFEAGIAYNARIMPVKVCVGHWEIQFSMAALGIPGFTPPSVEGGCADADMAAGIRYAADNGADVINVSIGGPGDSLVMREALAYAVSKGVFVALAAGNGFETGNEPEFPAKYAETMDGVMAVAAVGRTLHKSYFSNTGPYVEIAAPGGDIRAGGQAGGVWQVTIRASDSDAEKVVFPRFDRYAEASYQGTSMASPHVAGVAALIKSQLGAAATPAVIEQILKSTARACDEGSCAPATPGGGARTRNDTFGAGLVQPRAALFGSGLRK